MRVNGPVQLYPFARVVAMLIVGIVVGDRFCGQQAVCCYAAAAAALLTVFFFLWKRPVAQTCVLFLSVAAVGAWRTALFEERERAVLDRDTVVEHKVIVLSPPVVKGKVVRVDAMVAEGPLAGRMVRMSLLRAGGDGEMCAEGLGVGDGVAVRSRLEPPSAMGRGGNGNFDYVRWMRAHNFVGQTFVLPWQWRAEPVGLGNLPLFARMKVNALRWRERLSGCLDTDVVAKDARSVTGAMVLGDKSALDSELKDSYSVSGASHLLALSGLHLGVIYMVLSLLFVRYPWSAAGQAVSVAAIWAYVLLVGLPVSVVRAATMITIYAAVAVRGNRVVSPNSLALTATVMLVVNPSCLWDIGFQMSFAAVLAIFVFFNPIYNAFSKEWLMVHSAGRWLWSVVSVSVAAQIGAGPLALFYFGRVSCYFLLTNIFVMPLATLAIYVALAYFALSFLPFVSRFIGIVLSWVVSLLNDIVVAVASLPGASIENVRIGVAQLYLIYFFFFCLYMVGHYCWKVYCFTHYRVREDIHR